RGPIEPSNETCRIGPSGIECRQVIEGEVRAVFAIDLAHQSRLSRSTRSDDQNDGRVVHRLSDPAFRKATEHGTRSGMWEVVHDSVLFSLWYWRRLAHGLAAFGR